MNFLIQCLSICVLTVSAIAQPPFTLDPSYGDGGVAEDPVPQHWLKVRTVEWHAEEDGSAVLVRIGPLNDTVAQVRRFLKNGEPDPFYGKDGMTSIRDDGTTISTIVFVDGSVLLGGIRAGRLELKGFNEQGTIDPRYFWQDEKKDWTMDFIGVHPSGDLVFSSKTTEQDDPGFTLRMVKGAPRFQQQVDSVNVELGTIPFHDPSGGLAATPFIDSQGRLLMGRSSDNRMIIVRILEDGSVDEDFGNALGYILRTVPDGQRFYQQVDIRQLQDGAYLVVIPVSDRSTLADGWLRVYKFTPDGKPFPGFGDDGLVTLAGKQISNRGVTELPNGDVIILSYGTVVYSHVYHLRRNGAIVPGRYGDFDTTPLLTAGQVVGGKWLYGMVGAADTMRLARFVLDRTVTSVAEQELDAQDNLCSWSDGNVVVYSSLGQVVAVVRSVNGRVPKDAIDALPMQPLWGSIGHCVKRVR